MNYTRRRFRSGSAGFSIVSRRPERGVILVIAAASMVALLGMAALTIDIGRMATAAQRAQEVADATALAGALRLPSQTEAETQLTAVLAANNAETSWPTIAIDTNSDITYYTTGDTIPDYGILQSDEYAIKVQTHVRDTFAFAGIFGDDQMHVVREATAKAEIGSGGGLPCMFARSVSEKSLDKGIDTTGSNKHFYGRVHSNNHVDFGASSTVFHGSVEYRNNLTASTGVTFMKEPLWLNKTDIQAGIEDYPVPDHFTWENYYQAGGKSIPELTDDELTGDCYDLGGYTHVTGDVDLGAGKTLCNGFLVVDGDVHWGTRTDLINVTVIANGSISYTGSGHWISPFVPELMFMSFYESTNNAPAQAAINVAGSGDLPTFKDIAKLKKMLKDTLNVNVDVDVASFNRGTYFAPNGKIYFTGSAHTASSLIADKIKITGSNFTLTATDTGGGSSKTRVFLIK